MIHSSDLLSQCSIIAINEAFKINNLRTESTFPDAQHLRRKCHGLYIVQDPGPAFAKKESREQCDRKDLITASTLVAWAQLW